MPETAIISCEKADPTKDYNLGEVYEITGYNTTYLNPIMDIPSGNNLAQVGIVQEKSPANNNMVLMKFNGVATVQYIGLFGAVAPGTSLGSFSGQVFAFPGGTGIGTVISTVKLAAFPTMGYLLVRLGDSSGSDVRWKEYDP